MKGVEVTDRVGISLDGAARLLLEDEIIDEALAKGRFIVMAYSDRSLCWGTCGSGNRTYG